MPGLIDTNVLLYAVNAQATEHASAHRFLTAAIQSADRWYLTEGIVYEFLRVATHPRIFPQPLNRQQALAFLDPLWSSPSIAILTAGLQHWALLKRELETLGHPAGNLFFDIRTVVLMREHGIRTIYSADSDFHQFKDLDIVNPVS